MSVFSTQFISGVARAAFRALPLSVSTKIRLRNAAFLLLGKRAITLPGYDDWQKTRAVMRDALLPLSELHETREYLWNQSYATDTRPTFLFLSHGLGGGTEEHIQHLGGRLEEEGKRVLVMRHLSKSRVYIEPLKSDALRLTFDLKKEFDPLIDLLLKANTQHIHVHHTLHFPSNILELVAGVAHTLNIPYDFSFHDYFPICPRFTLYDDDLEGYCGEPAPTQCRLCIRAYDSPLGKKVDVAKWREEYATFLRGARQVYTPNADTSARIARYIPERTILTRPHEEKPFAYTPLAATRKPGEVLQVVLIGAIAPHKGAHVLDACARDALERKLPIHFTVIGFTAIDHILCLHKNVTLVGKYHESDLPRLLQEKSYHLSFFPAVIPETYSFTLSHAMRFGLHPVTFDIGAIAERIRATGFGSVLPLSDYNRPSIVNDALLALSPAPANEAAFASHFSAYPSVLKDYYNL